MLNKAFAVGYMGETEKELAIFSFYICMDYHNGLWQLFK